MPFTGRTIMDERIRFVLAASRREGHMTGLCKEFGISRTTGYKWLHRYEAAGRVQELREYSRRPRHSPGETPAWLVDRIVSLRLAYGWGGRKLQPLLADEGISISETTINRVIKRVGLVCEREVAGMAPHRFVRDHPNDLWQMDFKGDYPLGRGRCYPLSMLDDHSRFALGVFALEGQTGQAVHDCLVTTFQRYGVPRAMLIDHGIPWWSSNGYGLTWVAVAMIKQGIDLCLSAVRHPQTQGKVERFHRTLNESVRHRGHPETLAEWIRALDEFVYIYNHLRGHEALDMDVPSSHYQPSDTPYNPHPPEWLYDSDAPVLPLNTQGCLTWHSQRYFVSEALANELVQVHTLDYLLLVQFRHMWIREIDLRTGRSHTLIDKARNPYV